MFVGSLDSKRRKRDFNNWRSANFKDGLNEVHTKKAKGIEPCYTPRLPQTKHFIKATVKHFTIN
jgi:hypothetical protein